MILIFEMFGTAMLTMLFLAGHGIGMFIGYFILLIFSARISGSHYNPIVTMAFMLRKDAGQFNKWLGILYMLAQVAGAYAGALFLFYCFETAEERDTNILTLNKVYTWKNVGIDNAQGHYRVAQCMVSEMFGAFILVLVYLTQTEENYKLSQDAAITLLIISASYVIGMALSNPTAFISIATTWDAYKVGWTQSPLNPAIALAEISFTTFNGMIESMHWAWIYLTFSWLGSLLAVLCFEFVFKKAQNAVQKHDEEEELHNEEEHAEITQPMME